MFGNNFGLFADQEKARRLLARLGPLAGRIVASTRNPYEIEDPAHLWYHERNRSRVRMPGQLRLRVRYREYVSSWLTICSPPPKS